MSGDVRQVRSKWSEPDKLRMALDAPEEKRGVPWFWLVAITCLALGFAAVYLRHDMAAALKPKPGAPQSLSADQIQVIDGDTIRVSGRQADIRLVGFGAPETVRAQCDVERERGYTAMRRLRAIVASASLELQPVPCACPPNTEGTEACNAGRRCGILRANGWDIGERLIAEGLAMRIACTATSCAAPPRPWCDAPPR
jgi:endonuclease YncB( thermonuclease family)